MRVKAQFIAALLLISPGISFAQSVQSPSDPDLTGQVQAQVVKTSLLSYSSSKLVVGLTLAIDSKRDLTVEQIVLSGLRINGLPVYAAPVKQRIQLHSNDRTLLPDPLPVTVYLHDLDSVSPLEEAVANGHTTLDGTAYATVRVNPLASVVLLSRHVDVAMNLHEDVLPFSIPGGSLGKNAALTVLRAAEKALHVISGAVSSGQNWASGFRHETMKQYAPHLLLAYAQFELRDPEGKTTLEQWYGVAVSTSSGLLLVPREALEPWKFDPEIADALQSKRLSLNKTTYDLWLWPASAPVLKPNKELNADAAMRLSQKQISMLKVPDEDQHKLLALEGSGKTQKISVEKRDSSADLALLRMTRSDANAGALQVAGDSTANAWDSVALFRFREGVHNSPAQPELIIVPAKRDGNRIELGELVDSATFGSPIVAPEGVIGIVQDESSGVAWPEAARVLKLDKFEAAKK